jgi:hypothetical protein
VPLGSSCRRCTLAVLFAAAAAPAQALAWKLPLRGCAVFAAEEEMDFHPDDAPRRRPAPPVLRAPHVPLLFASELVADGTHLRESAHDVRWLAPALAFDGRSGRGARTMDTPVPWLGPFGNVRVKGSYATADEAGVQRGTFTVATVPLSGDAAKDELQQQWVTRLVEWRANGTLVIERHLDFERGVVDRFTAELALACRSVKEGDGPLTLRLRQTWTLSELRPARGADFQRRIEAAVIAGGDWVHDQLAKPSSRDPVDDMDQEVGAGTRALMLLTLLHGKRAAHDTVIRARFEELRRAALDSTYPLSLALLAMDMLYAPQGEREALVSGQRELPFPRALKPQDRQLVQDWTRALLENRDRAVDGAYLSRWSYNGQGYDHSNTQYALLGLHAAVTCGAEVSRTVWHAAAQHLLSAQFPAEGKPRQLVLTSHAEAEQLQQQGPNVRTAPRTAALTACRGYGYSGSVPEHELAYGSMTAAGISSLTLCAAHLRAGNKKTPELPQIDAAIREGFAWLSAHRTLRVVAGDDPAHHDYWWYYWIYSLERACELSRVAWIDGWDWYGEGAEMLLAAQRPDGRFGNVNVVDQCFALLFLKRAQLPVITPR